MRILAAIVVAVFPIFTEGIVNGHPPAQSDYRFDAIGAFGTTWRMGLDPTNPDPATGDHNWFCSATLVSVDEVVVANHCLTPYGDQAPYVVRLRRKEDGSLGTVQAGVSSFYHAHVWNWSRSSIGDGAIGYLIESVNHVQPITWNPFAKNQPGDNVILSGWGLEGFPVGTGQQTELLLCESMISGFTGTQWLRYPQATQLTCGVANHDSGGPVLRDDNGVISVIAVEASQDAATLASWLSQGRPFSQIGW